MKKNTAPYLVLIEGDVPSKKNSKQILMNRATGKRFVASSPLFQRWQELQQWRLPKLRQPLESKRIEIIFYPSTKRRSDLNNISQGILDVLVKQGIIKDDNWFDLPQLDLRLGAVDKKYPRAEIYIY